VIAEAKQGEREGLRALLLANGLPLAGLEDAELWVYKNAAGEIEGVIGLERHGELGLLRSLAVMPRARRQGLGRALGQHAIREARAGGLDELYLLTLTAEAFFETLGFMSLPRAQAPAELMVSAEFLGACPDSATLMTLSLRQPKLTIRRAVKGDAAEIAAIYNEGIEERLATFETAPRSTGERLEWLGSRGPRHPVLVAMRLGEVAGWASINVFNSREAYRWVGDVSVYVARAHRRQGVGRALLEATMKAARELDYHKLVLAMFPHNEAAKRLYLDCGFREVGVYCEQGKLDGRWVDTLIMERLL
jgi:L-amino acid N-acyltransferase YncA